MLTQVRALPSTLSYKKDNLDTAIVELKKKNIDIYFYNHSNNFFIDFGLEIYRCISPQLIPLSFGTGALKTNHKNIKIKVHPNALKYPHPFS